MALITKDFPGFAKIAKLHRDGTADGIDPLNGVKAAPDSGPLVLQLWQDATNRNVAVFNWKLRLSMLNGGLLETSEEFPFQAPQSGYQPALEIDMPASAKDWQSDIRRTFYVQLPGGNYGRIDLYLLAFNGVYTIHSVINPTGSPYLEAEN